MSLDIEKVTVPEGCSGEWCVTKIKVSQEDAAFANMRSMIHNERRLLVEPSEYTVLKCGYSVVMSDSPAERYEQKPIIDYARGTILINGLGLGVSINMCLKNPNVEKIFVVELQQDVIDLVANHYLNGNEDRLEIIHANALEWKPPKNVIYDAVWHDIWTDICADNWPEMKKLHRKYAKCCKWQNSWSRSAVYRLVKNGGWR